MEYKKSRLALGKKALKLSLATLIALCVWCCSSAPETEEETDSIEEQEVNPLEGVAALHCYPVAGTGRPLDLVCSSGEWSAIYQGTTPGKGVIKLEFYSAEVLDDFAEVVLREVVDGIVQGYYRVRLSGEGEKVAREVEYESDRSTLFSVATIVKLNDIEPRPTDIVEAERQVADDTAGTLRLLYLLHNNPRTLSHGFPLLKKRWTIATSRDGRVRLYSPVVDPDTQTDSAALPVVIAQCGEGMEVTTYDDFLAYATDMEGMKVESKYFFHMQRPIPSDVRIHELDFDGQRYYLVEMNAYDLQPEARNVPVRECRILLAFTLEKGRLKQQPVFGGKRFIEVPYGAYSESIPFRYDASRQVLRVPLIDQKLQYHGQYIEHQWQKGQFVPYKPEKKLINLKRKKK